MRPGRASERALARAQCCVNTYPAPSPMAAVIPDVNEEAPLNGGSENNAQEKEKNVWGASKITLTCPVGFVADGAQTIPAQAPTGQLFNVIVPEGTQPGQQFEVQAPFLNVANPALIKKLATTDKSAGRPPPPRFQSPQRDSHIASIDQKCAAAHGERAAALDLQGLLMQGSASPRTCLASASSAPPTATKTKWWATAASCSRSTAMASA